MPRVAKCSRRRRRLRSLRLPELHFKKAEQLPLSLGSAEKYLLEETEFEALLDRLDTDAVTWVWPMLNAERIARLHERSIRVYAWTVDDLPTMRRLRSAGVDGIISNRPDLLAQVP